ncbi:hypothetical protein OHB41_00610 [Streptomyces sp. NBC_01571]|uniref:hypothetical protein n=1 Tax=Streptomyces sp. NBC_01571 TaxID=2975883 RepID=UPI00224C8ED1|nr:hypothetical protein [Streptomyces sp. NBC_01571]MCX4571735.1 hypothetical protein [Streptomyces sp. NBC_01571]
MLLDLACHILGDFATVWHGSRLTSVEPHIEEIAGAGGLAEALPRSTDRPPITTRPISRTLCNLYSLLEERATTDAHVMVVLIDPETPPPQSRQAQHLRSHLIWWSR